MSGFLLAEAIAENDAGGAALKSGGRWYECSRALWQFGSAWPEVEFTVRKDGTVRGLRAARGEELPRYPWHDGHVQERMRRADGDCVCDRCGKPCWRHPYEPTILDAWDEPFLRQLCDGSLVKL
jgi:hypothetical protein